MKICKTKKLFRYSIREDTFAVPLKIVARTLHFKYLNRNGQYYDFKCVT